MLLEPLHVPAKFPQDVSHLVCVNEALAQSVLGDDVGVNECAAQGIGGIVPDWAGKAS